MRRERAFDRAARLLQPLRRFFDHRARAIRREDSLIDELVREELAHRRMILDPLGHLGLRVRRLVLLVVTETPVADQIDEHVASERAPKIDGEVHGGDARVDVVGVDVHDRARRSPSPSPRRIASSARRPDRS